MLCEAEEGRAKYTAIRSSRMFYKHDREVGELFMQFCGSIELLHSVIQKWD
jgi:hypothetical protein